VRLKPSTCNFRAIAAPGRNLLFNGVTGALYDLDDAESRVVESLLDERRPAGHDDAPVFRAALVDGGFLVDSRRDEASELLARGTEECRADDVLEVDINPTWGCNSRCRYCYIVPRPGRMKPSTEKAIGAFLRQQVPRFSEVRLSWAGGEPLLCSDTVLSLTRLARDVAAGSSVRLVVVLLTNGLLLEGELARRLEAAGLTHCHVTVDGLANTHDRLRPRAGERPSWAKTMKNLHRLLEVTSTVTLNLRVNVDDSNIREAGSLLDSFDSADRARIRVDLSPVMPRASRTGAVRVPSPGLLHALSLLARHAIRAGFKVIQPRCDANRRTYCSAEKECNFHIGPDGALMKCHDPEIPEAKVGRLTLDGTKALNSRYSTWHSLPVGAPHCRECRFLCLCGGGCRLLRLRGAPSPDCQAWFSDIENLIVNLHLEATLAAGGSAPALPPVP
jgi:uncharacterized protein